MRELQYRSKEDRENEIFSPKQRVYAHRAKYLEKMFSNGLRPVVYLLSGTVWPTVEACAKFTGSTPGMVIFECLHEGNFALFPEYFWSEEHGFTEQVRIHYKKVFEWIDDGRSWEVKYEPGMSPIKFEFRYPEPAEEDPEGEDLEDWEKFNWPEKDHGGKKVLVLDVTEGRYYRSITEAAEVLGVARSTIYRALSRDGWVGTHKLIV